MEKTQKEIDATNRLQDIARAIRLSGSPRVLLTPKGSGIHEDLKTHSNYIWKSQERLSPTIVTEARELPEGVVETFTVYGIEYHIVS